MTPEDLRGFLAAYELGSLKKAAVALEVSQPTLSRRLQRLEDVVGVQLFIRSHRGLDPTSYGHALARRARLIVEELELARREIARIRSAIGGSVIFGVSPGVASGFLPVVAAQLERSHPDLHMTIVEGVSESLIDHVIARRVDFAVCTAPLDSSSDLAVEVLGHDPIKVACGRGHTLYLRQREIMAGSGGAAVVLPDLLSCPWVMPTFRGAVRQWLESRFAGAGLAPPVPRIETSSMLLLKQILSDDRHLSFLPARLIAAEFVDGAVLDCTPSLVMMRELALVRLRQRPLSPAAEHVISALRQVATEPLSGFSPT
jgi:DNA-binding transcriptional LysR family regulator